ncbi:hypothetical protein [Cryobacterium cheniae]|nr:hypothetical protein [Cryobacterium cheniae]
MARTLGAKNRTPRELEAEAARLKEKARLQRRIDALKTKAARK